MPFFPSLFRPLVLALSAGALLFVAGCDTAGEDTIILPTRFVVNFTGSDSFAFNADDVTIGTAFDVRSSRDIDVASFLSSQGGFTKEEIVFARVTSVQLEVAFPSFGQEADFLDEVIFKLEAQGISATQVASQTTFPSDDDEVALSVTANRDVTRFLQADEFQAVMEVVVGELDQGTAYELDARLEIEIEVEDNL